MKSIIVAFTILSLPCIAQNHFIGLKGGMNYTNVYSTNLAENQNRTGLNIGFTYDFKLNERFNVAADFLYTQKGFTNDIIFTDDFGNPTGQKRTSQFNYDYLTLPLKGKFFFGNKFLGFLGVGIVPAYLINAKTIDPAIDGVTSEMIHDVTDIVTKFDLAAWAEIGADYEVSQGFIISTSIGYQPSLTNITNDQYFANTKIIHRGMLLSLGLKYALMMNKSDNK
ncbi:MAG: PorT family protein [Flavobacteriales bacterium]|nr:PorT family protein [Flavobacteriales bacterium]